MGQIIFDAVLLVSLAASVMLNLTLYFVCLRAVERKEEREAIFKMFEQERSGYRED